MTFPCLCRRMLVLLVLMASATPAHLTAQGERPRILLVNDDGIGSEGIAAMAAALGTFADLVVVAPAQNNSGSSHSTVIRNIRAVVTPLERDGRVFGYGLNATPADAAKFGILHFGAERPFDLVVSGINAGANTGDVAHYSGTIGAAMEAVFHGLPAIATSQDVGQDYALTARLTASLVRQVLSRRLPPGVMLSINVPRGALKGVKAVPMRGSYSGISGFRELERQGSAVVYESLVRGAERGGEDSDTAAYLDGYATVTPLRFDWTDAATLSALEAWDLSVR